MPRAEVLKAPFPAFGGKSRVADLVWARLGAVSNYIEPFAFSAVVLLRRPSAPKIETINDVNHYVANFWRATKTAPESVADHADWPVNEADLHARHRWLVLSKESAEFRERIRADPDYFDPKIAGWWVWGQCCWIGGGWCTPQGETEAGDRKEVIPAPHNRGVHNKRPRVPRDENGAMPGVHAKGPTEKLPLLGGGSSEGAERTHHGKGIHAKGPPERMPTMEQCQTGGKGVNGVGEKRPLLGGRSERDNGHGVNQVSDRRPGLSRDRQGLIVGENGRPQLADAYARGRGVHGNDQAEVCADRRAWLIDWFGRLADRLRVVRVCCGDWERVCGSESVTTRLGVTGVFLDPPYALHVERMQVWVGHLLGLNPAPDGGRKTTNRDGNLYASDGDDVDQLVARVHVYCRERGADPEMRLALCGYEGEHDALEHLGWECVPWTAQGGYGNRSAKGRANAGRERIWFSPGCLKPGSEGTLFDLFGGAS